MSPSQNFFEKLAFNPELRKGWVARYFGGIRSLILIVVTLTLSGTATFFALEHELNPDIQIPTVIVTTTYPGAAPEDIESLITIPIEEAVSGLSDTTRVSSTSRDNTSNVVIEFSSIVEPEKAKEEVQNAIDKITDLPERSEDPSVQIVDLTNQPVFLMALSAPNHDTILPQLTDDLKEKLRVIPNIEKVELKYRRDPEVAITVAPEKLLQYRISLPAMLSIFQGTLEDTPSGTIASDATLLSLSQKEEELTLENLRIVPLPIGNSILSLETIATVSEQPKPGTAPAFQSGTDGKITEAIYFSLFQSKSADTQKTIQAVYEVLQKFQETTPIPLTYSTYFDGAKEINKSFDRLEHDFLITIGLVFVVLLLFFGWRQSFVSALSIPFTFLITFMVMGAVGISINFISLFSLLLALGILVDNSIVVISALSSYYRSGKFTAFETALLVFHDFKGVIFTTTITTVWAFLPLLLSTGIIGEFIKPIPIVVSSALAISAAVALFIVIPFMAFFLGGSIPSRVKKFSTVLFFLFLLGALYFILAPGPFKIILFALGGIILFLLLKLTRSFLDTVTAWRATRVGQFFLQVQDHGLLNFDRLGEYYSELLDTILSSRKARIRTMTFLIIFMVFAYSLVPLGYVVNEFFPDNDADLVYIGIELPIGTTPKQGETVLRNLLPQFTQFPEIQFVLGEIGATPPVDNTSSGGKDFNQLLITAHLTPAEERAKTSSEVVTTLEKHFSSFNQGKLSVSQLSGGPPAGSDLQIKLLGEDFSTLELLAQKTKTFMESLPGTSNVSISISSAGKKLSFTPDQAKLISLGLTGSDTANLLRILASGLTIKEDVRFGEEKRDLVVRFTQDDFSHPDDLGHLLLTTPNGKLVPLTALGTLTIEKNPTLITREDEQRSIAISASVADGYVVTELNKKLEDFADTELQLPDGYTWKTGGVNEENNKSVQSIMYAMILSAILIFGTMVIQFNSFRKAMIVLLVIPIAVSGVFIFFALFGIPLSFPALIGVLALFGIVVNNSIIMVDKINKNLDLGLSVREAVVEGATSRLEPILLTAITTIVGLIPITLSDPIWQGLGGAIIAGLTFSGIAKLFFIPVIYEMWFDHKSDHDGHHQLTDDYRASFEAIK